MPIPVINDHFAAQVILRGISGSPKDVYTNTFYFRNDSAIIGPEDVADQLTANLQAFYGTAPTTVATPVSIASRMSGAIIADNPEVRVYDLGSPAPRYPIVNFMALDFTTTSALPSEVAACLSYVAQSNQPRNRGRIYLGPLAANTSVVADGRPQVDSAFRISALASAKRLMDISNMTWSLYSPTSGTMKPITGFWMDNAFDTQRRRGEESSGRVTTGTYLGQNGTAVVYL